MSAEHDHIALANVNNDALDHLLRDYEQFPEWIATVAFYKAVQIAEAVFAHDLSKHSMGHDDRRKTLQMERYRQLHRDYVPLLTASRIARYLEDRESGTTVSTFRQWRSPEIVRDELVMKRLRRFEQNCLPFLSDAAKNQLKKR